MSSRLQKDKRVTEIVGLKDKVKIKFETEKYVNVKNNT